LADEPEVFPENSMKSIFKFSSIDSFLYKYGEKYRLDMYITTGDNYTSGHINNIVS
jgi:hypothetical protein